ncbi:hypothetical protein PAMA_014478 [Pampus argenteus]
MDTKEIVHCALQIEKSNADRSYGNILTLLGDLDKSRVTAEQLETTHVVQVLYRLLKTCSDGGVKKAARCLLSKWKRQYSEDTEEGKDPAGEGVSTQEEDVKAPAEQEAPRLAAASSDCSSIRAKCVQLLLAALSPEPPDQDKAAELAGDVEQHIHKLYTSSQVKYKACVRSKVANLRNPKSGHLRQGLLSGSLSPEAFAWMSAEEMAGAELRQLREKYSSQGVSERQLPRGTEGTETQKIRCERCGGSDCRVTQVSRGALFLPAWVRPGGPDEDAMTFVTCSQCGQQWYHSSWVSSSLASPNRPCSLNKPSVMMSKSALLKVILLGDGGVGKSSLMNRYVTNKFDSHLFHTIGVEFLNKELQVDGHAVTLQIWDTAGQERFRSLRTPFYRGSDCCLLTFSVDDGQSFRNLSNWKNEFAYYADVKDPDNFPFVVLGNKLDVPERQVSGEDARQWCRENGGHPYFETSAKDATNVASAFEEAVRRILALDDRAEHLINTNTVDLQRKTQSDPSCC